LSRICHNTFSGIGPLDGTGKIEIDPLQAVGDAPAVDRLVLLQADAADQLQQVRLLVALDDDQRQVGFEQQLQVVAVVHPFDPLSGCIVVGCGELANRIV
jgi:hypothetical protein